MLRRWRVWLWGAIVASTCALTLLVWRTVVQDRDLAEKRVAEQREALADRGAAILERKLSEVERGLEGHACPPDGVCLTLSGGRMDVWPVGRIRYRPDVNAQPEVKAEALRVADEHEFRGADPRRAIAALKAIPARDPRLKAAVLVRLARNHRKLQDEAEARRYFLELAALGAVEVGGMPAALAGRLGLVEANPQALKEELLSGRWPISQSTFSMLKEALPPFEVQPLLEEAVERVYGQELPSSRGRAIWDVPSGQTLVVWRQSGEGVAVHVSGASQHWLQQLGGLAEASGFVFHMGSAPGPTAIRLASSTGLPWTLQVSGAGPADTSVRNRLVIAVVALALITGLICAAGWTLDRTLRKQMELAHEQSNFVSAVSHEFRTPLTTLKQLTELLWQGRVAGEEDRQEYYRLLREESHRLERLVDGLLTFGRLEAGRPNLRFEKVEVAGVIEEAVRELKTRQPEYEFTVNAEAGVSVRADREAFRIALANLLDNAVKYSPECRRVWVCAEHGNGMVTLSVRDQGIGIPRAEQKQVFEKFLRGEEARRRGIRGTGVGLATVKQLAQFHGGSIEVDSEAGIGSTFQLRIPEWREA